MLLLCFLIWKKAYDTTWRYGILKDIHKLGLRGRLPTFIENFLADRAMQVRVGSSLSDYYDQEQGLPQGGVLSTTLFNIKINDIVKCLGNLTNCSLYFDDFCICYRSKSMATIERQLQQVCDCSMFCCTLLCVHSSIAVVLMGRGELIALLGLSSWCLVVVGRLFLAVPRGCLQFVIVVFPVHTHLLFLNKIENWATSNGFKFSKSKTQCVHFCQLCKQHDDPVLHLYGSPIPVVEESKFLGILFDRKKVSNGAKIRNRYNQIPHLTQDTNGKVTNSQKTPQTRAKRSALSQQVTKTHI